MPKSKPYLPRVRDEWLQNSKRKESLPNNSYIYSDHFEKNYFELDLKVNAIMYFESHSNTTSLYSHLYPNVMICKLKKLILEVSLDLKVYFIYTVYSYRIKKILHLNFCSLFLLKKSKTLYSGHLVIADTFFQIAGVRFRQV